MTITNEATERKVTPVSATRRHGKHARRQFLRSLVEQELQSRRLDQDVPMEGVVVVDQWKDLSEDELLQFLHELEQDELLDAAEEVEQAWDLEQAHLNDQWRAYEQWGSSDHDDDSSELVICPMCQDGRLLQSHNIISCCNAMDGSSCSLRLVDTSLSILELSERLRYFYEEHGSICRGLPRIFQMNDTNLCAACPSCGTHRGIADLRPRCGR